MTLRVLAPSAEAPHPDALNPQEECSVQTEYMTIDEAADLLRRPRGTLYQWRHHGQGPPARKLGRRLLYKRADVVAWIDAQPLGPSVPAAPAA
jgi:excisionase family DNA binding protein